MTMRSSAAFGLTSRQLDMLRFLSSYMAGSGGIGPTVRECAVGIGIKSTNVTWWLLNALEERGHIRRLKGRERAIEVLHGAPVSFAPDGAPLYFVPVMPGGSHRGQAPADTNSAGATRFDCFHAIPNSSVGQHDHG